MPESTLSTTTAAPSTISTMQDISKHPQHAPSPSVAVDYGYNVDQPPASSAMTKQQKPSDFFRSHSLTMMAARRASFQQMQRRFAFDLQQRQLPGGLTSSSPCDADGSSSQDIMSNRKRRTVSFLPEAMTSSTANEQHSQEEPAPKKRRFQRRNSKTAAMLFRSMTDDARAEIEQEAAKPEEQNHNSEDNYWDEDTGLEIAEDLVHHIKLRRQSTGGSGY
jgi:hypothetical protein